MDFQSMHKPENLKIAEDEFKAPDKFVIFSPYKGPTTKPLKYHYMKQDKGTLSKHKTD